MPSRWQKSDDQMAPKAKRQLLIKIERNELIFREEKRARKKTGRIKERRSEEEKSSKAQEERTKRVGIIETIVLRFHEHPR